jgi:KUP system potassium uptake protein
MTTTGPAADDSATQARPRPTLLVLGLAALGVVFGDIGTSPLYALRECFHGPHSAPITEANVLGVLSLVLWAVTFIVCIQYLGFIMRADNRGEGGVFALLALVPTAHKGRTARIAIGLSLFGAALLYGDGMITPAISVLSAVEGLHEVTDTFEDYVVPIACGILLVLFMVQRRGSAHVGRMFGPVMLAWFAAISVLGAVALVQNPSVLAAVNPLHAIRFVAAGGPAFAVLGSVVLAFTGAEALYADMGHFGRRPIRVSWYSVVFPALLLNYFGQGARLLEAPGEARHLFFALVPRDLMIPMVLLATAAAVIASQALISGAFSLTRQAVQLGYLPRVRIVHTSHDVEGQIFVPVVNRLLMVACIGLVLAFQTSSALAAAYGVAVTGAMSITTTVFGFVAVKRWGWSVPVTFLAVGAFLAVNLFFFSANLVKFWDGGWFPLLVAVGLYTVMRVWEQGRGVLGDRTLGRRIPFEHFREDAQKSQIPRVEGTAVFLSASPTTTPTTLLHHVKHNKVLHRQVVLLSVLTSEVPTVSRDDRLEVEDLGDGFYRIVARYGFMQTPDVQEVLRAAVLQGDLPVAPLQATYVLGRETLVLTGTSRLTRWRKALFAFLWRNAQTPVAYYHLPPGRVVELGTQVEI